MKQRRALVVLDFFDAHQTLRNNFARKMHAQDWRRYPGVANAYCTTFLSDAPDVDLLEQTEFDLFEAADHSGIDEWEAICLLDDDILQLGGTSEESACQPQDSGAEFQA